MAKASLKKGGYILLAPNVPQIQKTLLMTITDW